jgi:hypothetical protein
MYKTLINKKLNNFNIYIILFLLYIFILNTNTNIVLCEEYIIPETTSNIESNYNYKKLFFYTIGFITTGLLLYYFFGNNNNPENFNISEEIYIYKKNAFGSSAEICNYPLSEIQKEIISKLTVKDYYKIIGEKYVNTDFQDLSDKILTNFEVYNMDIPIFHMSNFKLNTFYGVTEANLTELYSLPLDNLVAFGHYGMCSYYQLITVGDLIKLIATHNIII